jgi:hypothetical protein
MMKFATVFDFEMKCLESMERPELLQSIHERPDSLPADLREGMEGMGTDHLRLLLFAARLIHALRHLNADRHAQVPALG